MAVSDQLLAPATVDASTIMPRIDPSLIKVPAPEVVEARRRMTPRESLQLSFRLTEEARETLAEEIASSFPTWSSEEVLAERNRRWLRQSLGGELWDDSSRVLYEILTYRETGSQACLHRATSLVRNNRELFSEWFERLVAKLGVADEWQSILDHLDI